MEKATDNVQSDRSPEQGKRQCVYLPGTSVPAPTLKPIYWYEAHHRCGYTIEDMDVETYLFEALKLIYACLKNNGIKLQVLPLRDKEPVNIHNSWFYMQHKLRRLHNINIKDQYIEFKNQFSNKTTRLYADGRTFKTGEQSSVPGISD